MSGHKPKVGLVLQTDLPQEWLDEFQSTIGLDRSEVEIRQIHSVPMAGVALYLPQAVMLFLASFYLRGFLTEAGKDHYTLLKTATKQLWQKAKLIKVSAIGTKNKTEDFDRFQMAFSINGETPDGKIFKLVLQLNTSDGVAEAGIDGFIDLIRGLNDGSLPLDQINKLNSYRSIGGTTVVTVNPENGEIIPADQRNFPD